MNNYDLEVKQRFGGTTAYKEYGQKTANCTKLTSTNTLPAPPHSSAKPSPPFAKNNYSLD